MMVCGEPRATNAPSQAAALEPIADNSPSLRARLLNAALRAFVKRRLGAITRVDERLVHHTRRRLARMARAVHTPSDIKSERVDANGVPALWLTPKCATGDRAILYLHGGAYAVGSAALYRGLAGRLAKAARANALVIDYRLAPEQPYPAALEDALRAWRWLASKRAAAPRAAIAGDSAGAGLVLATLFALRDAGDALPSAALCLSPWTDLTGSGESLVENAAKDPYLVAGLLAPVAALYLAGTDSRLPYVSPVFGDFRGLPPLAIHVGSTEMLLDDSIRVARLATQAGVETGLKVWPNMPHVFQLFAPWVPEATRSIEQLGAFAEQHMASAHPG